MSIEAIPIITKYDQQRFLQFNPEDCANFYIVGDETGKRPQALYPTMGREHVNYLGTNRLIFPQQPRAIFKSINYTYVIVGALIYQIDANFNQRQFSAPDFNIATGNIWSDFLVTGTGTLVYVMLTNGRNIFVINESTSVVSTITDPNAPVNPTFVATFGNRFVVSSGNSASYFLSQINLDGNSFNPNTCFTFTSSALFNQASGIIRQLAVLHNQLYIFTDFTCDIWMNIPSVFDDGSDSPSTFPFKLNTSYGFDYGLADPLSLDVDFGRMCWLGKNRNGLVAFMVSDGGAPQVISTQAVNVVIQANVDMGASLSPYLSGNTNGFLYQYENSIFYRATAGNYDPTNILDLFNSKNCLEYNFESKTWHRCIELNGERSLIQKHVFFNNKHLVIVEGENTVYEMGGDIYINEFRNNSITNPQAVGAYQAYPFRYELITPIISKPDYSEFITQWLQIDFVWGEQTFYRSNAPFDNTVFIVSESSTPTNPIYIVSENGAFLILDGTNTPSLDDNHYNALFKPHIELYWSDDGGIIFHPADVREFSNLGIYSWRMRWYQLGASRNRCYKLVCVSPSPIVILGAVQESTLASGGAL